MPATQRAQGIFQRPAGSGIWLNSDPHLEGVLFTGREIPAELRGAVDELNRQRGDFGLPPVDLLPWQQFEQAWQ
jgi:hypothetical protein